MKRIAVFGGSFDPVHTEHIRVAAAAIESLRLDKLFVMPAFAPPHKKGKTLSSDEDRLQMCRLAFANVEKAEVSDYEIRRGGVSYTYLTCEYFRALYKEAEIFWLVGTDMLRDFPTWKQPQTILSCVTLAVCARAEKTDWLEEEQENFYARFNKNFAVVGYNGADVSSTKIRVLAGAGMRLTPYVDENTEKYIREKQLYEIAGAKEALSLEKESRKQHSLRVALVAAKRAPSLHIPEKDAITAALLHDCAKNLPQDSPLLQGFAPPTDWGDIPASVWHQFTGAYVAEYALGIKDENVLNAIRYHTSGRAKMSALEKLIFLADMVEEERSYDVVENIRTLFWTVDKTLPPERSLDKCLEEALYQTVLYLRREGRPVYPLTEIAWRYYQNENKQ